MKPKRSSHFGFTIGFLATVTATALATGTWRHAITSSQLERWGQAPADLFGGEPFRYASSLALTHGGPVFWGSFAVAGVSLWAAERRFGTRKTALVFLCAHLVGLLVGLALVRFPGLNVDTLLGTALFTARDVGGSAGYYGCLGLALAGLPRRAQRRWAHGLVLLVLMARFGVSVWLEADHATLHGDLVHPISYLLGWSYAARFASRSN